MSENRKDLDAVWYKIYLDLKDVKERYSLGKLDEIFLDRYWEPYLNCQRLRIWLRRQRKEYHNFVAGKASSLTAGKIKFLEKEGINWNFLH